ncbi:amidohydrolase [Candidatus Fermentibacteria bacterium]|nr:MAG: amidohydrolase [Candidatus Fermentibacteria bacterium]
MTGNGLVELRHKLHRLPEVSGKEVFTSNILFEFLSKLRPASLSRNLGGHGIAVKYKGKMPGNTVLLRCDMDALPIPEAEQANFGSQNPGVSHKCGHDGHMAIMCGVAEQLAEAELARGTVVLLFQPSEENGEGALSVITQLNFTPDYCFALHNLPGFPLGSVITRRGTFASASKGLVLNISGRSSHAALPQEGISPASALFSIGRFLGEISRYKDGVFATVVHLRLGSNSFGTNPDNAVLMATLRAPANRELNELSETVVNEIASISGREQLSYSIRWTDEFPATVNSDIPSSMVKVSAEQLGYKTIFPDKPFTWSEDFGHFTSRYPGALFGLGAGLDTAPLHSPGYYFPDDLIPYGVKMFMKLVEASLEL